MRWWAGIRWRGSPDGCGLPADGAVKGTGVGTKLVKAMAQSLSADLTYDPSHRGVRVVLRAEC